ncbi:hypothetical protein BDV12DRAFT_178221 [Aspergillus spectabilis]
MDALFAEAMKATAALRKTSVPWKPDEPVPQSYYAFNNEESTWVPKSPSPVTSQSNGVTKIALYTWNIDFMLPFAEARMDPALAHLETLTNSLPPSTAPVIFLQECTPSDLTTIANTHWIQTRLHLTDIDHTNWATEHYGTTMLIDIRIPITSAFRVHYSKTRMDRDAFFVDISLGNRTRLCTSHLESMALDPPYRIPQMQMIAKHMHAPDIDAAITAGDFNAIQPFDRTLHIDNGNNLKDAFLELGGKEDTEEAYTWGQQAPTSYRERFGCSRMDKVYFCGRVKVVKYKRFGEGVLVEGEQERRGIVELGFEEAWVTDHLGVCVEVEVLAQGVKSGL